MFEQHGDRCELHKAQEVGGVVFPANQQPPLPLQPGKEPFDEPAAVIAPQVAAILGLECAGGPMRRDHIHTVLLEVIIELIAGIRAIADQVLGLGFQHVEVKTELHQGDLMMIGRMRAHRQRQPMTIHNREDLHASAPAGRADIVAAALGRGKRGIDEALAFVDRAFFAQRIGQLRENLAQHLAFAPLLKPAMHRFVVGIALGQQVPLRTRVQNPEHRLQDVACWHRFAPWSAFRNVFFGKLFPNPFPLVVAQSQHAGALLGLFSSAQPF